MLDIFYNVNGLLLFCLKYKTSNSLFSRVIIVGDFNVSPKPIDTCDPGEDLDVNNK